MLSFVLVPSEAAKRWELMGRREWYYSARLTVYIVTLSGWLVAQC
jgi:hypothetical protein